MSYLKLCQILNQSETEVFYQENADKEVLVNNIQSYPVSLQIEVIDFESEEEFQKRGKINSFNAEVVVISQEVPSIRQEVFNQLIIKYPELNI